MHMLLQHYFRSSADLLTLFSMLGFCVLSAGECMPVDLGLDLLGGVCDKDGAGGVTGTHLPTLPLHSRLH